MNARREPPRVAPATARAAPPKAPVPAHDATLAAQRRAGNRAVAELVAERSLQRVKIRVDRTDPAAMKNLRAVPAQHGGDQALDEPDVPPGVAGLREIGVDEDIILEGHGIVEEPVIPFLGPPRVVAQGGKEPAELAELAHRVPKPAEWNGNIILLGCSTGDIAKEISKVYFRLAKRPVTVMGTKKPVQAARKPTGEWFVGSAWEHFPDETPPPDLPFVLALRREVDAFQEVVTALRKILAKGRQFFPTASALVRGRLGDMLRKPPRSGTVPHISESAGDLATLCERAARIVEIDDDPAYGAVAEAAPDRYFRSERIEVHTHFLATVAELDAMGFWDVDRFIVKSECADTEVSLPEMNAALTKMSAAITDAARAYPDVLAAADELATAWSTLYADIIPTLVGLAVKPIAVTDPSQATHHRMVRKKEGWFGSGLGEEWDDEAPAARTLTSP